MEANEAQELKENAEHAKHDPTLAPGSLSMAVLVVLVAVVTLVGHRAHTEEVVLQAKASDQWAFYQAKNIRWHTDELFTDLTSVEESGIPDFKSQEELDGFIAKLESDMREAAKKFEFEKAAKLRDTIKELRTKEFLFA